MRALRELIGMILELKGLKKAESEKLLEAYNLAAREGGQKIKKLFNLS